MPRIYLKERIVVKINYGYKKLPIKGLDRWVEAMRSGMYRQATDKLCDISLTTRDRSYCCLGIKCEIDLLNKEVDGNADNAARYSWKHSSATDYLPLDYAEYLGFRSGSGRNYRAGGFPDGVIVTHKGIEKTTLAMLNDSGLSFAQIADIMELIWRDAKHVG